MPQSAATQAPDDDRLPSATEPDYRLVNLAMTLRLPSHRMSFELTHRFDSNLMEGTFAQNASNLFGLDQGAAIGLELRYALARHVEVAIYRTNIEKTIQLSSKIDLVHEHAGTPLGVSALISIEGTSNFHTNYQPGVSIIVSRAVATRLALYVEPTWVNRTGIEAGTNQSTSFVGLGARARVRRHLYLVAEVSPRVNGDSPDKRGGIRLWSRGARRRTRLPSWTSKTRRRRPWRRSRVGASPTRSFSASTLRASSFESDGRLDRPLERQTHRASAAIAG